MQNFLAVDLGATSGRTVISSFDGESITMREFTRFANPQIPSDGHLYWDLPGLYNQILEALKKAHDEGIQLTSIGIDTWGCDFAFFGKDGSLLSQPFCYRDSHTDGAMEKFFAECMPADEVYQRTGIQFMPFNSLFQLYTIGKHSPELLQQADKILFIPDALSYMLTGNAICESTVASTSQLQNPRTGELDSDLLSLLGLDRNKFGANSVAGAEITHLTPYSPPTHPLPSTKVIAVAGHDTASAVAAVPAEDENYAYLSCGTWSLLGVETPEPIITEESRRLNFTNEGGIFGTTRFLKNITGLWIFENCRKEWGTSVPANVNELNALCHESSFAGLINPDDAVFAHPASMLQAIAEDFNRRGEEAPETPADFVRCIFRSLAHRIHEVLDMLRQLTHKDIQRLHVIGGGSLNVHLMQMLADELQMPVICGPAEGTALGNTLVQIQAANPEIDSLPKMRKLVINSIETKTYIP